MPRPFPPDYQPTGKSSSASVAAAKHESQLRAAQNAPSRTSTPAPAPLRASTPTPVLSRTSTPAPAPVSATPEAWERLFVSKASDHAAEYEASRKSAIQHATPEAESGWDWERSLISSASAQAAEYKASQKRAIQQAARATSRTTSETARALGFSSTTTKGAVPTVRSEPRPMTVRYAPRHSPLTATPGTSQAAFMGKVDSGKSEMLQPAAPAGGTGHASGLEQEEDASDDLSHLRMPEMSDRMQRSLARIKLCLD